MARDDRRYSYGPPRKPSAPTYKPTRSTMDYRLEGELLRTLPGDIPLAPIGSSLPPSRPPRVSRGVGPGGGGGGGFVRPTDPDPLGWRNIERTQERQKAYEGLYGASDQQLASELSALAARESAVQNIVNAARQRAAGITGGLAEGAVGLGQRVGDIYSAGGSELDRLAAEYAARQQAVQSGATRTLGAFGVGPEELGLIGPTAVDALGVMRGTLSGLGTSALANIAQLPQAYQALGADYESQLSAGEQGRLAQVAADRAAAEQQAARRRAELTLQLQRELAAMQDQEYARQEQYR